MGRRIADVLRTCAAAGETVTHLVTRKPVANRVDGCSAILKVRFLLNILKSISFSVNFPHYLITVYLCAGNKHTKKF